MKRLMALFFIVMFASILLSPNDTYAQTKTNYLSLGFASECCGPPNNKAIFEYIKKFKQKYLTEKLNGYVFGPFGPEGDHSFIIDINNLSEENKTELIEGIEALIVNHKTEWRGLASLSKNQYLDLREWKKFAKGRYQKYSF